MTKKENGARERHIYGEALMLFDDNNPEACLSLLYKLSAENYAPANTLIGYSYMTGFGVEKNRLKARKYFEKAAQDSHCYAKAFLARMDIQDGNLGVKLISALKALWLIPTAICMKLSSKQENQIKVLFR